MECIGLVFKNKRCTIWQPQIPFCSAIFTQHGMKPDPEKTHVLQDLPTPINQKVTLLLGLNNYLQPFIPDLSDNTAFLRTQLTNWDWNPSTNSAFQQLKAWTCHWLLHTNPINYDWEKPVTLHNDASKYGLGAALLWDSHPIAFTSKSLTNMKTKYANIRRECLSIWFGLKTLHLHIWQANHHPQW